MQVPSLLDNPANCKIFEDETTYRKECCYNGVNNAGPPDCNGNESCHFKYEKDKTVVGGLEIFLKLEGCHEVCTAVEGCEPVPDDQQGRFGLTVDDDFVVESVAATPAAYNTALGSFITQVFVPTTGGRVYRVDLNNGEYDKTADEGDMIASYTIANVGGSGESVEYGWDTNRDDDDDPIPWFDTETGDPIMVDPTLALNYERNLVLFFGTGRTDDLTFTPEKGDFYAVEQEPDTADPLYRPKNEGVMFCDTPPCTKPTLTFEEEGERLFGKPLVAGGSIIFTTFIPNENSCDVGGGRVYVTPFDDIDDDEFPPKELESPGTPSSPSILWTPTGPQVVAQSGASMETINAGKAIQGGARIAHWGKVL
jgi:hypothetical protein